MSEESTEKKGVNWFYVLIAALFLLIALAGGYLLISRNNQQQAFLENLGFVAQDRMDEVDAKLEQCQNDLTIAKVNIEACPDAGMMEKEVMMGDYKVMFEYPALLYEDSRYEEGDAEFSMMYDYVYEMMEYGEPMFVLSTLAPQLDNDQSEEFREIEIDGNTFTVRKVSTGDGGIGGKSFIDYYYVMLENDLYAWVTGVEMKSMTPCVENENDSVEGELPACDDPSVETLYEYATSDVMIDDGIEMLVSLSWEVAEDVQGVEDEATDEVVEAEQREEEVGVPAP